MQQSLARAKLLHCQLKRYRFLETVLRRSSSAYEANWLISHNATVGCRLARDKIILDTSQQGDHLVRCRLPTGTNFGTSGSNKRKVIQLLNMVMQTTSSPL